jgi:RNA polymerase sigma factor (sigma-70 family)
VITDPLPPTLAERAGEVFARYRSGDEAKMADLVALLTPILWHTVRAQRLDAANAEDVLQTTWLSLVRAADSITDPRAVLQWMVVTARREAWRVSRREARTEPTAFDRHDVADQPTDRPETTAIRTDEQDRLWRHIAALPEKCRQLLRVIAFADRPDYAAVATALGMPVGSIGPTRGRCLAKLRARLAADPGWEMS